ncbi:glycosyltransferase family 2 protein [Mycolicibacterium mucogenicum]|uniref:glycosyltransferase family 2 protein n=1 Tax=Mycolicibacterium mucogenicum TaxID=56689 RepID=UPI002269A4F9|nr:glycosyltransferase family 2 protein [Mycolicibacterium mucogenicum]MCX8559787.1 glycosyltransferase family 2 protein [Mycolicibacterium mucogenicum]
MTSVAIVIPFRDRGSDNLRCANLVRILDHWRSYNAELHIVSDDRSGSESFNRSAAYNAGARLTDADVIVYAESDLIVDYWNITKAVELATAAPGLVVPFSRFMAINELESGLVRTHRLTPQRTVATQVRGIRKSIGAINVVSRTTLDLIGPWDETFEGAWYDDDAMARAFEVCCGPTRFVDGPAWHLYHLSGARGPHLTDADREATARNKARYELYRRAETPERIRELTAGRS